MAPLFSLPAGLITKVPIAKEINEIRTVYNTHTIFIDLTSGTADASYL